MPSIRSVTLVDSRSERVSVCLRAAITEEGDLQLEGQDVGSLVQEFWGDFDYEYWITVPAEHLGAVLEGFREDFPQLIPDIEAAKIPVGTLVLWALQQLFEHGVFKNGSSLRQWLDARGIPSKFFSY